MAIRKGGIRDTPSDHRLGCDPVDQNEQWLAIYAVLKAAIGEWEAFNWFSHCRFLSVHDGTIRLEHWGMWQTKEALNRHGLALCRAAGVRKALIRFNGGTVPQDCTGRKAGGFAEYTVPLPQGDGPDLGRRRDFIREAMRSMGR